MCSIGLLVGRGLVCLLLHSGAVAHEQSLDQEGVWI
jgi:hypothetical protein